MENLHRQVLPFLLRRMKEDVLQDLPPKIIQDYHCDLSPLQVLQSDWSIEYKVRKNASKNSDCTCTCTCTCNHFVELLNVCVCVMCSRIIDFIVNYTFLYPHLILLSKSQLKPLITSFMYIHVHVCTFPLMLQVQLYEDFARSRAQKQVEEEIGTESTEQEDMETTPTGGRKDKKPGETHIFQVSINKIGASKTF